MCRTMNGNALDAQTMMDEMTKLSEDGIWRNNGSTEEYYDQGTWTGARIQRVITLSVLMVVSFIGNTLIIIVLTCSKTNRTFSRVNIFILNLAVGDLFIALVTILSELIFEVGTNSYFFNINIA